ncbi:MAG TPA: hypothetical protein VGB81_17080 [Devosia sp.]
MNKKIMLVAAVMAGAAIGTSAVAQPGQCSVTGYGTFDCDVVIDGGGFSFALPDGQVLAFTLSEADLGSAFLLAADAQPGKRPRELDDFKPKQSKPGCWVREDGFEFCALVFEGEGT